ncbi:MAG: serine/threonine protein kinase [Labilithrix sp.]|nr:serine/threonine protein kinase [Labilithrix sp.]MCW5817695.1 serine/threonine protein kinase [Labilithrix sp.]
MPFSWRSGGVLKPVVDTSFSAGDRLGDYELLCPVGQGGMAAVWIARLIRKRGFEKLVAIKMILSSHSQDETFQEMFFDEARIASRIEHPNVAHIHDLGDDEGIVYLVMEYIDGHALTKLRKAIAASGDRFPLPVALRVMADVCAGLHNAHELRSNEGELLAVVHRDVSPQNILVSVAGVSKVIDFGVAKAANRSAIKTNTGFIKGKLQYMAPEQALARPVDRRADVWAVGAVLYHLLASRPPYEADNQLALLHLLERGHPPAPLPASVPAAVAAIVARALAHDLGARYAGADALGAAIEETGLAGAPNAVSACLQKYLGGETEQRRTALARAIRVAEERTEDPTAPMLKSPTVDASAVPRPAQESTRKITIDDEPAIRAAIARAAAAVKQTTKLEAFQVPSRVAPPSAPRLPPVPLPIEGGPDLASRTGLTTSAGVASAPNVTMPPATPSELTRLVALAIGIASTLAIGLLVLLLRAKKSDEVRPPSFASAPTPASAPAPLAPASALATSEPVSEPIPRAAVTAEPPPEPVEPAPSASVVVRKPVAAASSAAPKRTPIERAREAALLDDPATVRALLESKARRGQATEEEVNLVYQACKAMRDRACVDDLKRPFAPPQ